MFSVFIDGASRGNPGEAGVGIVMKDPGGNTLYSAAGYTGKMTNNAAEYTALILALTKLKKNPILLKMNGSGAPSDAGSRRVIIHSDSELIVKQMNGIYRVKEPDLKKLHQQASGLLRSLPFEIELKHIRREQNREADRLANIGIDSKLPISL